MHLGVIEPIALERRSTSGSVALSSERVQGMQNNGPMLSNCYRPYMRFLITYLRAVIEVNILHSSFKSMYTMHYYT